MGKQTAKSKTTNVQPKGSVCLFVCLLAYLFVFTWHWKTAINLMNSGNEDERQRRRRWWRWSIRAKSNQPNDIISLMWFCSTSSVTIITATFHSRAEVLRGYTISTLHSIRLIDIIAAIYTHTRHWQTKRLHLVDAPLRLTNWKWNPYSPTTSK